MDLNLILSAQTPVLTAGAEKRAHQRPGGAEEWGGEDLPAGGRAEELLISSNSRSPHRPGRAGNRDPRALLPAPSGEFYELVLKAMRSEDPPRSGQAAAEDRRTW